MFCIRGPLGILTPPCLPLGPWSMTIRLKASSIPRLQIIYTIRPSDRMHAGFPLGGGGKWCINLTYNFIMLDRVLFFEIDAHSKLNGFVITLQGFPIGGGGKECISDELTGFFYTPSCFH